MRSADRLGGIKAVGVGTAGGRVVACMRDAGARGVELIAIASDHRDLTDCEADVTLRIGSETIASSPGLGPYPELGADAAVENRDDIREALKGADAILLAAGEGGWTGTGAAPVVAEVARRELGALTVGVVSTPFAFERHRRMERAEDGIEELRHEVDCLLVIPNQKLLQARIVQGSDSVLEAYRRADDVLRHGVQGITDLIVVSRLGLADVEDVLRGSAAMGIGVGSGESRAVEATENAVASPLLGNSICGATRLLLNVTGGEGLDPLEVDRAADRLAEVADPGAHVVFGSVIDRATPEGAVSVTVYALQEPA